MLWIWLILVLIVLAALRYGADSRDGQDRYPFVPPSSTASDLPAAAPVDGYRRAHTPADDLAALARAARAAARRSRLGDGFGPT
jgi:hypothetical protein